MQNIRFCLVNDQEYRNNMVSTRENMRNIKVSKKSALKSANICAVAGLSICSPDGNFEKYVTG